MDLRTYTRLLLLPKVKRVVSWESYRGICLLNVMSNMYMAGIMILLREWEDESAGQAWKTPLLFGFQAECQCEDIFMCLQESVPAAKEWPKKFAVCVASADIKPAFDFVTPAIVVDSMYSCRIPPMLVRGLVREPLFASAQAVSSGIPPMPAFGIQTCIRQGGWSPFGPSISSRAGSWGTVAKRYDRTVCSFHFYGEYPY